VKGKVVQSVLNAPLNDPIEYKVMGYNVSLRRSEAFLIEVVSEEEARLLKSAEEDRSGFVDEEEVRRMALKKRKHICVALVGNPNCGKTTLFNYAAGGREHVGNYSGVTVDAKEGNFDFQGYTFTLVDLPGTYSLSAYSPEEKYVREYITDKTPDVIINVVDSTNLERNLYLTTQLIDMNVRTIVALNMYDEFERSGDILDYKSLGKLLGIPFVPTIAKKKFGIDELFRTAIKLYEGSEILDAEGILIPLIKDDSLLDNYHHQIEIHHHHSITHNVSDLEGRHKIHEIARHIHINHGVEIEKSILRVKNPIALNSSLRDSYSTRFLSIKLLEKDPEVEQLIQNLPNKDEIIKIRDIESKRLKAEMHEDAESAITDAKYGFIAGALKETLIEGKKKERPEDSSRRSLLKGLTFRADS